MAAGIFAVLDDIAALMDDVAIAAKLATRKTAGILGDDIAINADKATGFLADRELPVIWSITKGAFLNKIIIIPAVLLLNYFIPSAITLILFFGGAFLAFEAVEKITSYVFKQFRSSAKFPANKADKQEPNEKAKIKAALTTDFILSVEIVIIALETVLNKGLTIQIITVCLVALIATIGVYGLVALIVRMDNAGFALMRYSNNTGYLYYIGFVLVKGLPIIIKLLNVTGIIALLLVAGGIFMHKVIWLEKILPEWPSVIKDFTVGLIAGALIFVIIKVGKFILINTNILRKQK